MMQQVAFEIVELRPVQEVQLKQGWTLIAEMDVRVPAAGLTIYGARLLRGLHGGYQARMPPAKGFDGRYVIHADDFRALVALRDDALACLRDAGLLDAAA